MSPVHLPIDLLIRILIVILKDMFGKKADKAADQKNALVRALHAGDFGVVHRFCAANQHLIRPHQRARIDELLRRMGA